MSGVQTYTAKLTIGLFAAMLVMASAPTPAAASPGGPHHVAGWVERCPFVKTSHDDPIFDPGQPGVSTARDFFGNVTTDAYSTYESLRQSPVTKCIASPYDASAYWTPSLSKDGLPVRARAMLAYYLARRGNQPSGVQPIPAGLKVYGDRFYWTCSIDTGLRPPVDIRAPHRKVPFDCSPWPGSRVTASVSLPSCWDGVNLDSADHRSHMAYPDPKLGCPADHPVVLPALTMVVDWFLTDGTGASLTAGGVSTFRGMFFDAWDPAVMTHLVGVCMNDGTWCGRWPPGGPPHNRPPVIRKALIVPANVHQTDTPMAVAVRAHDPDGDAFMLHYQWQDDGVPVGSDAGSLDNHDFTVGDYLTVTITAVDDQGHWSRPVTSPATIVGNDIVVPKHGRPGGILRNVHGGGFGPNEQVDLHLDGPDGPVLATVTVDVLGRFPCIDVGLPKDISAGLHWLFGVGARSGIVGDGPFWIR